MSVFWGSVKSRLAAEEPSKRGIFRNTDKNFLKFLSGNFAFFSYDFEFFTVASARLFDSGWQG